MRRYVSIITAACVVGLTTLSATGADARAAAPPSVMRMAGQLMLVRMPGRVPTRGFLWRVRHGEIGGVVLYSDNYGAAGPTSLVDELQQAAAAGGQPRLLIAIDQEGGVVRRLAGPPSLAPAQMTTGSLAEAQGTATAQNLRGYGINIDLAPVLDIGRGGFITSRTFGSTPRQVATRSSAFARGLTLGGVVATGKHFPGLGYARKNTDKSPTVVRATAAQLDADLLPYRRAIAAGLKVVMASTAVYPALDDGTPAACSAAIVTHLLRERLGFRGVVVTDALDTPAVNAYASTSQAAVDAINAGVDIVLAGGGSGRGADATSVSAYRAIVDAVRDGSLPRAKLVASYNRVLALKRGLTF